MQSTPAGLAWPGMFQWQRFGPGDRLLADWERNLDLMLLAVALLLVGFGYYWLVGA